MSAVETARSELRRMKRSSGESIQSFAERLYYWQMEVYSSYAGRDLDQPFGTLPQKTQAGWLSLARSKSRAEKKAKLRRSVHRGRKKA